ncbi:RNA polymerase sigma factor [Paenibacillus sp. FA6]|uniref:RNA polymerase sigma factor n=1 Tax=Paenibacillus sp. FA6 TaxID=3413029 RepID=UPI003F655AAB
MTDFEHIYDQYFKALKSIHQFKGNCKINVWLCQIAKNTYFSYLDKQKRFTTHDTTETASENCIEESLLIKEEAFRIHQALHGLEEPYKEVFTLRVFGELSFAQISQIFGKTESWSRVTFHRAKRRVQDRLKEE